jgi:hypothetical protein
MNLLRVPDRGSCGARDPHVCPYTLRSLRSGRPSLRPARDDFFTGSETGGPAAVPNRASLLCLREGRGGGRGANERGRQSRPLSLSVAPRYFR